MTGNPEVEKEGRGGATMILPGKKERRRPQLDFFKTR
jgi:hypothetical protein